MATLTWTEISTASTTPKLFPGDVCWAPFTPTPLFIIVGNRTSSADIIQTSPDGSAWTVRSYVSVSVLRACAFSPTLNRAVVVGSGVAGWSDDGVTWNAATLLPEANNWMSVVWFASASLFVAVSQNGTNRVMTSADGKTWTAQAAAAALSWQGVTCSSGALLVAVAGASVASTQLVMTSIDGASWTLQTHASITVNSFTLGHSKVSYATGLGLFGFAVKDAGVQKIMTSPDGVTWTLHAVPSVTLDGLLWIPDQALWIVFCDSDHYLTSTDGATFTDNTYPLTFNHNGYGFGDWSSTLNLIISPDTSSHDSAASGTFVTPPSVTSIVPKAGSNLGGQAVTIRGVGFSTIVGTPHVLFDGLEATSVVVTSDTTITAVTPPHDSGAVDVEVVTIGTLTNGYTYQVITIKLPPVPTSSAVSAGVDASGAVPAAGGRGGGRGGSGGKLVGDAPYLPGGGNVGATPSNLMGEDYQRFLMAMRQALIDVPNLTWGPQSVAGSALTAGNDTNVTLTLGGTPLTALLRAASITAGWVGTLATSRGGTGRANAYSYAPGSFTVDDGTFAIALSTLQLGASDTVTALGTGSIGVF